MIDENMLWSWLSQRPTHTLSTMLCFGERHQLEHSHDSYSKSRINKNTHRNIMILASQRTHHYLDEVGHNVNGDFAWKTISQILDGLCYIHKQNIIHIDLTPNIIFLTPTGCQNWWFWSRYDDLRHSNIIFILSFFFVFFSFLYLAYEISTFVIII